MGEKLLTIEEVAQYLNLSVRVVRELVEKGELPAYKIGGSFLRFKRKQMENYRRRRDFGVMGKRVLFRDRGIKSNLRNERAEEHYRINRRGVSQPGNIVQYRFWERLEDFLYYNDFYILSLILLILIVLAVFRF